MNRLIRSIVLSKKRAKSTPTLKGHYEDLLTDQSPTPPILPNVTLSTIEQRSGEDIGFHFKEDRLSYYIVCDGHGRPGSLAKGHIAHTLIYGYKNVPPLHQLLYPRLIKSTPIDVKDIIRETYLEFDKLCFEARTYGGSCVANVIVLDNRYVYVAHLGDCRASIWTEDEDGILSLYETKDHTAISESDRIISAGGTISNNRIEGNLIISRAFGDWRFKVIDGCFNNTTGLVISDPTVYSIDTHGKEVGVIIGSDGLFCNGITCNDYIFSIKQGKFKGNIAKSICSYVSKFTNDDVTALVSIDITSY